MPTPSMNSEILKTLEAYKQAVAPQPGQGLNPDVAKAWNLATGLQAYNLETLHTIFPVLTPIRNITSRVKGKGKKVEYKAITSPDNSGNSAWVAEGSAAALVTPVTTDVTATYRGFARGTTVTMESIWAGEGYVDMKSLAVVNLLRQVMIDEENAILFGQNATNSSTEQAPGAVGAAPNITSAVSSTTGGSIATGTTYAVKQTVVTAMGESTPSAEKTFTIASGSSGSVVVTPVFPSGQPVIGFRIYAGTSGSTMYLVAAANVSAGLPSSATTPGGVACTTNGDAITITSIPSSGANPPGSDGTASSLAFNGLYTQMWGGSGATLTNQAGALTVAGITGLLKAMWNSAYKADPDFIYCNVQESAKITSLTLGAGTPYQVLVNQGEVNNATANFRVARFTNAATGSELPIRVHPTIPQGTMLFLTNKLPGWYVPTDVPTIWEMDLPQDYVEIDYPPTSSNPLYQSEVRFYGALKLYVPGLQGALYGINNS